MIVNKNSNQSQLLKTCCSHYEWWVNWFEEIQRYKTLLTVRLNKKKVINDVTPAMKTFRAERRYSIRYRVHDRVTNWKPIIQACVTAVTIGSSRHVWFGFFLNYIISSIILRF